MPNRITHHPGLLLTANTAKDGTGVVATVMPPQPEDVYVSFICFQPAGTNTATAARVFLNNGGGNATANNNTLLADVTLPATTNSEVATTPRVTLRLGLDDRGLFVPKGSQLLVTLGTTVAAGYHVWAAIGDSYVQLDTVAV